MEILVFGMHRSGTSVVSGIIQKLGIYGGEEQDLSSGNQWNPKGYWELKKLVNSNNRILRLLGRSWDHVLGVDEAVLKSNLDRIVRVREEILPELGILQKRGDWVIKDPRMCILFPVWAPVLQNPVAIVVVRNPLEVAVKN